MKVILGTDKVQQGKCTAIYKPTGKIRLVGLEN